MGKIDWARVLLGGLVAGFIINIFEYVTNGVVLAADWDAAMKALGRHLSMSPVAVFIVAGFIGCRRVAENAFRQRAAGRFLHVLVAPRGPKVVHGSQASRNKHASIAQKRTAAMRLCSAGK